MAEYVEFSAEAPGFLLLPSQPRFWLNGDMAIRMHVRIDVWPDEWAYLCAKFQSHLSHEFLIRIKGSEEGRWGYGDGSGEFNAIKWNPGEYLTLGHWHELIFIRRMDGLSHIYADGTLIAEGEFKRQFEPAMTTAPITLFAREDGSSALFGAIREFDLYSGSVLEGRAVELGESLELGAWVQVGGVSHG